MNCNICGLFFLKIRQYRKHKHCNKYPCSNRGFKNIESYKEHLDKEHGIKNS
jgi:hypothetical protein